MTRALPATAPVVIVGAGLAGACTAAALLRRGVRALILERRETPGIEASARSAGMVRTFVEDAITRAWLERGAAAHAAAAPGTFRATGGFLLGLGSEDVSRRIAPATGRGSFFAADGLASAALVLRRALAGCDVRTSTPVLGVEASGSQRRVLTAAGNVTTPVIVNASGAWAGCGPLGQLPLESRRRHVHRLTVAPDASASRGLGEDWPYVWDLPNGFYFRPAQGGLVASACDETAGPPGEHHVDAGAASAVRSKLARLQPGLLPAEVAESWSGQRTFAPDERFVIGYDPRDAALFWVAGLAGHGVTAAPALGELAAELILAGPHARAADDVRALSPARLL